ncbi:golgin subfamily A member 6-like protein 22 [Solenopsis invicta]|uniref:golgin subfamily A member 6-like protein 22 n=1 Tax=Solenopsis invicta TaxID=13686 RepID=UPI000E33DF81|nr:golgin subfamily A member 6-like protein 22 [Solenopsis invicta]
MEDDWEGEFTYVGVRGCTVIDYVIVSVDIRDRIYKFRVGDRVDSDHMPLEMEFSGGEEEMDLEEEQKQEEEEKVKIETILWDDEAKVMYAERTEELCNTEELEEKESDTLEEEWEKIKKIVKEAMVKIRIKRRKKELGHKDWWDRSCTRKKRGKKNLQEMEERTNRKRQIYEGEKKSERTAREETRGEEKKGRGGTEKDEK